MDCVNKGVLCDVTCCRHNEDGCKCRLDTIKVTNDCADCTCCGSFSKIED